MSLTPPGSRSHLERLLSAWADGTQGVTAGRLRRFVGVTVIASMLDAVVDHDGRHRVAFKGGSALELRFGFGARATRDLDAAFRGHDLDEAVALVSEAVAGGWNGFSGRASEPERIENARMAVRPVRLTVKLLYKGKDFVTVPVEMSAAEGRSLDSVDVLPPAVSLLPVRLCSPERVPLLPVRYQIAQKLHACADVPGDGQTNDRVRDLADLHMIELLAVADDDLPLIRAACVEIFAGRATHEWPPTISAHPGWGILWSDLAAKESLPLSLDGAMARVRAFIERIAAS